MQKKKELPRKRKRFVKKIMFFTSFALIILLIAAGIAYYLLIFKNPKFHPVVQQHQVAQSLQPTVSEKNYEDLQSGLEKDQIQYSSIKKGSNSFVVTLQEGGTVTFSSQKDIMTQIASLQYILSHLTMEGRQFSTLDLRFDQPVIVLKP